MPTVAELKTQTQGLLKKAAKVTAHPDDILRWFQECLRRLQPQVHLESNWNVPLTGATESYALPVGTYPIFDLHTAYCIPQDGTTGSDLSLVPLSTRWQANTVRFKPALPGEANHTLYVYPATLTGSLELYGERKLDALLGETDVPAIREDFHDLLPLFAAMRFGGQDEDFLGDGRYSNFRQEFMERKAEFMRAMAQGGAGGGSFRPKARW